MCELALSSIPQDAFDGGMVRQVEGQRIPENAAYDIVDGLLDDDLAVYRRGGTAYETTADPPDTAYVGIADVHVAAGRRTLAWSNNGVGGAMYNMRSGVPQRVDGSQVAGLSRGVGIGGFFAYKATPGGGVHLIDVYGGAQWDPLKTGYLHYNPTGTLTNGSRTLTLTVGDFQAGLTLALSDNVGLVVKATGDTHLAVIESVQSNTSATLRDPWAGATLTNTLDLAPLQQITPPGSGFQIDNSYLAAVGASPRLVVTIGNKAYFSARGDPTSFAATDFHELPSNARIIGADSVEDTLVLFTTAGVWAVSNMAYDLTDAFGNVQHSVAQLSKEIILWGDAGIAGSAGGFIVPAVDDVYILALGGAPVSLSSPIRPLYRSYVKAGYRPGLATVYRGHYFLPIMNGFDTWVDTLVCRLDGARPAWTRWAGKGGTTRGFARRIGDDVRQPELLNLSSLRVMNLSSVFVPTAANKNEADGSTHQLTVITRDFSAQRIGASLWKYLRARYELTDAATDGPYLSVEYQLGPPSGTWTLIVGNGTASDGTDSFEWSPDLRAQAIRFRIRSNGPTAKCVVRSLEVFFRASGKR